MSARPETFDRYRLLRRLHVGLLAEVWRAEAVGGPLVGRPLVLKRALPTTAEDGALRRRFQREIALAERVPGAVLVAALASGERHGLPYLVLPFVRGWDGRALRDRTARAGRGLPAPLVAHVAATLARGLAALHAVAHVHQDVTPGNVLVGADGDVRLCDLGAALPLTPSSALALARQATAGYAPPEWRRSGPPTPASDVWQLGVVLGEIAGPPPSDDPSGLWSLLAAMTAERPVDRPAVAAIRAGGRSLAGGDEASLRTALAAWCGRHLPPPRA